MMHHAPLFVLASIAMAAGLLAGTLAQPAEARPPAPEPGQRVASASGPEATERPLPTPTLIPVGGVCPELSRVPNADVNHVFFDPSKVGGYGELCNPNLLQSMWNQRRAWLSLVDPGKPYHPLFNGMVWKCGCR